MSLSTPAQIEVPFAESGLKDPIPAASDNTTGRAGYDEGFPPVTMIPKAAGGIPPFGQDVNGILYEITQGLQYAQAGNLFVYDSAFATAIGGYNEGALVLRADLSGFWLNTVDANTTDPDAGGAGWVPGPTYGVTAVTMTSSNVTLTAIEYGKPIIVITGLLTADLNLIFPAIAGQWIVLNNTTGNFSITCKTASGTGVVVKKSLDVFGDGTNIYPASSAVGVLSQNSAVAGGTADALTATVSPAATSLASIAGVPFTIRAASVNTTTTPTFAISGLTAKTIVKGNNMALAVGDIPGAGAWLVLVYDETLDVWVLLNPASGTSSQGITKLASGSVTNQATIDIVMTAFTAYQNKRLILTSVTPVVGGSGLVMRTSANGGASYDAGATDYGYVLQTIDATNGAGAVSNSNAASAMQITGLIGTAAGEFADLTIDLFGTNDAGRKTRVDFVGHFENSGFFTFRGSAGRAANQVSDAVRLLFLSGNIESATWTLYGWN